MSKKRDHFKTLAKGCPNYKPCPICYSCENKAVHLYSECEKCEVPWDHHNHTAKSYMIRRKNYALTLSHETKRDLGRIGER